MYRSQKDGKMLLASLSCGDVHGSPCDSPASTSSCTGENSSYQNPETPQSS